MGLQVPVDKNGRFAVRQILPPGPHTVTIRVVGPDAKVMTFTRNLSIADRDWFLVAIGDLTASSIRAFVRSLASAQLNS